MLSLILLLVFTAQTVALPDNDNFVLYADDIGGCPVVSAEGYLFLIGPNITKIDLVHKVAHAELELYSDDTNPAKVSRLDCGVLSNDDSLLLVFSPAIEGPHCALIAVITTADMVMQQDNCFKVGTDNVFGPKIADVKPLPTSVANSSNIFFAVGHHADYIGGASTAFVLEFEILDTFITNVLAYKILHSDFDTFGHTPGFGSLDFDSATSNGLNLLMSGIIKDSTTEYVAVLSVSRDLTTVNWMKYVKQKSTSALNTTSREILTNYDSGNDQVVVLTRFNSFNSSDYSDTDHLYMFAIKASDGSMNWEIQVVDYATNRLHGLNFAIHARFNQLILMNSNGQYSYYHTQTFSLADGSLINNVQFDILFPYSLAGIVTVPKSSGSFETDDYIFTGVGGYIFKANSRKANLASATDSSLFYPLTEIYYDNYTLPETNPTDFELLTYSPSGDFFQDEAEYDVKLAGYSSKQVEVPTLKIVSEVAIGFNTTEGCSSSTPAGLCQEEDTKIIPNTGSFNLNKPYTKDGLKDSVMEVTFQLFEFSDLVNPISSSLYSFTKQDGNYTVKLAGLPDGSYLARAVAKADPHHTYYEFTLIVKCISNCKTCSENDVCDVCDNGYVLDYARQCVSGGNEIIDGNIVQGLGASMIGGMLLAGIMKGALSPNIWVMINTLQILRTILLLKVNIPLAVRKTIESSTVFAIIDIGLYDFIIPEPGTEASIMKIMDGDELLGQYFEEYGVETYRFIDYTLEILINVILLFVAITLLLAGLSYLFLKFYQKNTSEVSKKLKFIFFVNGFIRIYLEIMLNGIIYSFVNLRSVQFNSIADIFSYLTLLAFVLLVIGCNLFIISYSVSTELSKWSHKLKEFLTETLITKGGIITYHLTFVLRRVALSINIIMLGVLGPNIHITFHVLVQAITIQVMLFYPMFENRFQKVSNLIMEVSILYIFASVYIFQNSERFEYEAKVSVLFVLFSSQFLLVLLTVSKSIREMLIEWKEKKLIKKEEPINSLKVMKKPTKEDTIFKSDMKKGSIFKSGLKEERKFKPKRNPKHDDVLPMKHIWEFDERTYERDAGSRVSVSSGKAFHQENDENKKKSNTLEKLLSRLKRRKEAFKRRSEQFHQKNTINKKQEETKNDNLSSSANPRPVSALIQPQSPPIRPSSPKTRTDTSFQNPSAPPHPAKLASAHSNPRTSLEACPKPSIGDLSFDNEALFDQEEQEGRKGRN
ncbi:unnamed protein product [Moneuplotes crassus]|uniref:TRP C-terminal domain-containing protein n=1 Tax=Euplotes crassus TaxID=5936 RepID=A0AAD1X8C1_EUPCR|nr:unnamed protein product [Moneuplotes crassus]